MGAQGNGRSAEIPTVAVASRRFVCRDRVCHGSGGYRGRPPDRIGEAWDRALAADHPVVLDIRCDPEVPPIPPHATYEQIKDMTAAILKGDPGGWHLVYQGMKTKAQEYIPG